MFLGSEHERIDDGRLGLHTRFAMERKLLPYGHASHMNGLL